MQGRARKMQGAQRSAKKRMKGRELALPLAGKYTGGTTKYEPLSRVRGGDWPDDPPATSEVSLQWCLVQPARER